MGDEKQPRTALAMQGIALGASLRPLPRPTVRMASGRASPVSHPLPVAALLDWAAHLQLILPRTPSPNGSCATCQLPAALHLVSVDPPAEPWQFCSMHQEGGEWAAGDDF